ncbi:lactonase family protein [Cohnella hongkongensis]|uniref:Lactonase family protein n=1 Tax=Cohnella hongkongensis TaxID=178337 RepID=A0ABV9F9W8_9BACL
MTTRTYVFIGSYAEENGPGLYACSYDGQTGSLTVLDQASGLSNPTFLVPNADAGTIYAITELKDEEGKRSGAAAAFRFDPKAERLQQLNLEATTPGTTCHIELDRTRRLALTSSYHGGMLGVSPVLEDGRIGPAVQVHRHEGASVLPVQSQSRVHSAVVDRYNRYAIVSDLGLDKLFVYKIDAAEKSLSLHSETSVAPGSGPRHFVFHPQLPYGYGINELNGTINVYAFDADAGRLSVVQTIATLPEGYEGSNACADIHLSPDGKFLYGSNRGHDSLAVYRVGSEDGRLTLVQHAPTLGGHPRNFAVSPDGRFVLVANRDSHHIVTFARDAESGKLRPAGIELEVSRPICLRFAAFA